MAWPAAAAYVWVSAQSLGPAAGPAPGLSPPGRCPMTTAAPSTALATIQPAFTDAERLALAGFLAGYRGLTRELMRWTCASSPPDAVLAPCCCSPLAAPTSSPSLATWKPGAERAPPSPGGCVPSRGSINTPSRKNSSSTPRPLMSGGRESITSLTPSRWTTTNSARCWSPPGSARRPSMR